jgi:hypothetical protein
MCNFTHYINSDNNNNLTINLQLYTPTVRAAALMALAHAQKSVDGGADESDDAVRRAFLAAAATDANKESRCAALRGVATTPRAVAGIVDRLTDTHTDVRREGG